MRRGAGQLMLIIALTAASAAVVQAQAPHPACSGAAAEPTGQSCQTAVDVFQFVAPQIATLGAGGNASLGQTETLGRLGGVAVAVKLTGTTHLAVPEIAHLGEGAVEQANHPVWHAPAVIARADVTLGAFGGLQFGGGSVGRLDVLGTAFHAPGNTNLGNLSAVMSGGGTLGYGVRVGILEGSGILPNLALTYLRTRMPDMDLHLHVGTLAERRQAERQHRWAGSRDTVSLQNLQIRSASWRVTAGRDLWFMRLAAGIGSDDHRATGSAAFVMREHDGAAPTQGAVAHQQRFSRLNTFANVSFDLGLAQIAVEVGRTEGPADPTYNQFGSAPARTRGYSSFGLRIGHHSPR